MAGQLWIAVVSCTNLGHLCRATPAFCSPRETSPDTIIVFLSSVAVLGSVFPSESPTFLLKAVSRDSSRDNAALSGVVYGLLPAQCSEVVLEDHAVLEIKSRGPVCVVNTVVL